VGVSTGFGIPGICEAGDGERSWGRGPTIQREEAHALLWAGLAAPAWGSQPPLGARSPRLGLAAPAWGCESLG